MDPVDRTRQDRCPGVLRPWPAEDGLLVRLRLPGGRVGARALTDLAAVSGWYGDGRVHLTSRANLQVRGLPGDPADPARLPEHVVHALAATGLLPSRRHDLSRNLMASPCTGRAGGRADLRPVVAELDRLLCALPALGELPGRFLFVLDDGRGDLVDRSCDLGLVALGPGHAQLRLGSRWGDVVALEEAAPALSRLALAFMAARGTGERAAWHVDELGVEQFARLGTVREPDPGLPPPCPPLAYGPVEGGLHHAVGEEGLDRAVVDHLAGLAPELVVTPWRGIFVPQEEQ